MSAGLLPQVGPLLHPDQPPLGAAQLFSMTPSSSAGHCCAVQGKTDRSEFTNWLCHELTGVCKTPPPPLPKVSWTALAALMPLPIAHCGQPLAA